MLLIKSMSAKIEKVDEDVRTLPEKYLHKDDFKNAMDGLKGDFNVGLARVERSIDAIFRKLDNKEDKSASIGQRKD